MGEVYVVLTDSGQDHGTPAALVALPTCPDLPADLKSFGGEFAVPSPPRPMASFAQFQWHTGAMRVLVGRFIAAGLVDGPVPEFPDNADVLRAFAAWLARKYGGRVLAFETFGYVNRY